MSENRGLRLAACVALAAAISAGGILAAIPEARARVQRVVFEWFDDHANLVFDGEGGTGAEGFKREPTYVPEGVQMTENEKERGIARVIYENKDGIEIMFLCMVMESGKKFTFNNEDSAPRRITIQGEDATLFKADEPGKLNRLRICVLAAALCLGLTVGYCASAAEPAPTTVHADYWSPGLFLDGDVLH